MKETYFEVLQSTKGRPHPCRSVAPPNRLELRQKDFLAAFLKSASSQPLLELKERLQIMTGREHIFFAPSCRAAIAFILTRWPQTEVVLPAYTCPVVKQAAELARKKIVYVDIDRKSLNATSKEFEKEARPDRILIPTHIFGLPTDIETICDLAKTRNCLTVEDAAAAFGSRREGKMLGTFADIGVISFERSKRLPAFRGAAIIINNEKAFDLEQWSPPALFKLERKLPIRETFFAIIYNLATSPWIYGRISLPYLLKTYRRPGPSASPDVQNDVGQSPFYNRDFHPYQAALILRMLGRIDKIRDRIEELVSIYEQTFKGSSVTTFLPANCDRAGLLRYPVAFSDRKRSEILKKALAQGLFLEINYDIPLPDRKDWGYFPNACWAAQNIILLPLYARLSPDRAARLASKLANL
ncbi:MAG TPA: DegT/DnrJ/EryC1/StrS family aminotransferase [Candidatus Saccharicenans sp.]|nr:DegT/DnrJ/EryC1/StrS family aminotransferase [Candidatus Saccharicenans sp.]HPP24611.1 DegT/DnrJ/EryC1/StrS family aminotransferase [Candidatus Saccharicenans sp.]HQK28354.1 DegT/DnrJ/EryC1/StrS family aminotransferase [Smithellaceae bacterium]